VIELITGFVGSPNVDSGKLYVLRSNKEIIGYPSRIWEACPSWRACLLQSAFLICCTQCLDVGAADPREHFLASLIIAFLGALSGKRDNDGFVSGPDIVNEMSACGYNEAQIRHALRRLALRQLIETPHAHFREINVYDPARG
jgi:hypothetical protein